MLYHYFMTSPILFIFAILILLFTPGPTNTLLWTSGALVGVRRSLSLLMGELLGYLSAILLILLIFEPILQRVPQVERFLAIAVGIYIGYLAFSMWMRSNDAEASAGIITVRKVFIVTFLNPKAFIFALTLIPIGHDQIHWYFVALSICIMLVGLSWILFGYIVGSAAGRKNLTLFNRFSSVMLTGFAGFIVLSAWQ
jgi:threonine/homoserine/homoserine lactone efflux protein